jgi:hypothetical protein
MRARLVCSLKAHLRIGKACVRAWQTPSERWQRQQVWQGEQEPQRVVVWVAVASVLLQGWDVAAAAAELELGLELQRPFVRRAGALLPRAWREQRAWLASTCP